MNFGLFYHARRALASFGRFAGRRIARRIQRRGALPVGVARLPAAPVVLAPDQVILIEGIHALNPELTAEIPRSLKFLVYISALTQLAIDYNSRISTTDNRLLRRMVRDNQFRRHAALQTLRRWPSVLRGEERWIFPFQQLADAVFNSSLDYELAVIKPFAAVLLNEIKPTDPEYAEARRLSGILHDFVALTPRQVPGDSILREYIGGSLLRY